MAQTLADMRREYTRDGLTETQAPAEPFTLFSQWFEDAVKTLEQAVLLRPNDAEINDHLGDAYWKAGRRLEAKFQWNVAASVDEVGNVKERVAPKLAEGLTEDTATE